MRQQNNKIIISVMIIAGIMEIVMGSMGQAARMMKTKVVWWETRGKSNKMFTKF
jgi:hypothetical protein